MNGKKIYKEDLENIILINIILIKNDGFTDGLNKSDKNEGLLKRLKSIESKNNNQLLALRDIHRPAIRGRDDDDDDYDDDDDVNNKYKKIIEDYKNNKIKRKEIEKRINKINYAIKMYKKNDKKHLKIFLILKIV